MNRAKLVGVAVAFGVLSTGVSANEYYGSAQLALSNVSVKASGKTDSFDSGMSVVLAGGMSLKDKTGIDGLSVEAELTKSLSSPSDSTSEKRFSSTETTKSELSYFGLGAYGAYTYPITSEISVKGRAGFVYTSTTLDWSTSCSPSSSACNSSESFDDSGLGLAFGASASYAFNDKMRAIVEITRINSEMKIESITLDITTMHIGAGVSMDFDI